MTKAQEASIEQLKEILEQRGYLVHDIDADFKTGKLAVKLSEIKIIRVDIDTKPDTTTVRSVADRIAYEMNT